MVFNNVYGYLGQTKDAKELIEEIKKQDIELQKIMQEAENKKKRNWQSGILQLREKK